MYFEKVTEEYNLNWSIIFQITHMLLFLSQISTAISDGVSYLQA